MVLSRWAPVRLWFIQVSGVFDEERTLRVLVVDDHPIVCKALATYLEQVASSLSGATITTSTVHTIDDAVSALKSEVYPDFIFLDLNLDKTHQGTFTLRRMQEANISQVPVIIFTGMSLNDRETPQILRQCYNDLNAHSILLKDANIEEVMFKALPRILNREPYLSDEMMRALLRAPTVKGTLDLSPRQWDVAHGIADGLRNKEIANKLGLTEGNVRQMVSAIYRRLGVHSRIAVSNTIRKFGT
jgi:two-component system nitrate/nitrite response regulator NarP